MAILGIDPGTNCGWAVRDNAGGMLAGVWHLKGGRHEGGGMRYVRLKKYLRQVMAADTIEMVFYEEVRGHKGTDAAHIYGGIVSTIQTMCEEMSIPYAGIPVGTIKRMATGNGGCGKPAMIAAAEKQWPDAIIEDDNEADARWIAEIGFSLYVSDEKPEPPKRKAKVEQEAFI